VPLGGLRRGDDDRGAEIASTTAHALRLPDHADRAVVAQSQLAWPRQAALSTSVPAVSSIANETPASAAITTTAAAPWCPQLKQVVASLTVAGRSGE
jgi:hypothetical protein